MVRIDRPAKPPAPRYAPAPEGPEEIAERVRRAREGLPTAARRRLARAFGLERLSPARQVLTLFAAAVEISLLGLGSLTGLPTSWLLTAALLVLPLLLHYVHRKDGKGADHAEASSRARGAGRAAGGLARRSGRARRTETRTAMFWRAGTRVR